jgi:transposase
LTGPQIAERVGCTEPTVVLWRRRFAEEGLVGLEDRARKPPPRTTVIDAVRDEILTATLTRPPAELGITHWSSRLLAEWLRRSGTRVSHDSISRLWRQFGIAPWRCETFKFSTDPQLEAKVRDVVGLYLNPPDNAIVLSVDEKSQVQALDRTAPMLPLRPGMPERQTHDYKRHGTTTLFAALEIATGKVTDACYPRHRHQEFLRFLKQFAKTYPRQHLHLVCDNCEDDQAPTNIPTSAPGSSATRGSPALHPDLGILAEHGRDLFRHHHPPSHPPRQLHQRPRPHQHHPPLHRQLQRPLPTLHLDQRRRHHPRQSATITED